MSDIKQPEVANLKKSKDKNDEKHRNSNSKLLPIK